MAHPKGYQTMQNTVTTPAPAAPAAPAKALAPTPTPTPTVAPAKAKAKAKAKATAPTVPMCNKVALPLPTGPLLVPGKLPPVNPNSHRAYAQATIHALAGALPKGFATNQLRAALVLNVLPLAHPQHNVAPPTHGWAKHNMATWCQGQGWVKPA